MPYANYSDKLAAMREYSKTPAGQAAKARSHANYVEKRRELARRCQLRYNPLPLVGVMKEWK